MSRSSLGRVPTRRGSSPPRAPSRPNNPLRRTNEPTALGSHDERAEVEWPATLVRQEIARGTPQALIEAVEILNSHRDEVQQVMTRYGYTDPNRLGGYLDRDLPGPQADARGAAR